MFKVGDLVTWRGHIAPVWVVMSQIDHNSYKVALCGDLWVIRYWHEDNMEVVCSKQEI